MKLLNKTNIYTSVATILLLLICITTVYWLIINKIDNEQDEHLLIDKSRVIDLLKQGEMATLFGANVGEKIYVAEIPVKIFSQDKFRDYTVEEKDDDDDSEDNTFTYRELLFQTTVNNKNYEIKISHSLSEGKEIGEYIATTIIIFLLSSLAILFVLNRYISKYIWAPFYSTLYRMRNWTIKNHKPLSLKTTNIDEFTELNTTVNSFTQKIITDYSNLKEFTENISHETQTPVAIISAKVEMLMQEENYSENQKLLLYQTYKTIQRLKKLNETLVVLTRIDNNQFIDGEQIDLVHAINDKLAELADFITVKNITITKQLESVKKEINPALLNMLLNNLFINAIKYNVDQNGSIDITANKNYILITNTGADVPIDKENVFSRFKRYKTNEDSIGLGLSIIKKIVDFLNWEISYEYAPGVHSFKIWWGK
jgi:signal transduction histidine kinase